MPRVSTIWQRREQRVDRRRAGRHACRDRGAGRAPCRGRRALPPVRRCRRRRLTRSALATPRPPPAAAVAEPPRPPPRCAHRAPRSAARSSGVMFAIRSSIRLRRSSGVMFGSKPPRPPPPHRLRRRARAPSPACRRPAGARSGPSPAVALCRAAPCWRLRLQAVGRCGDACCGAALRRAALRLLPGRARCRRVAPPGAAARLIRHPRCRPPRPRPPRPRCELRRHRLIQRREHLVRRPEPQRRRSARAARCSPRAISMFTFAVMPGFSFSSGSAPR